MPVNLALEDRPVVRGRSLSARAADAASRARRWTVLRAHALADRLDWLPSEWGQEVEVDVSDADAVAAEWLRQLRLWAAFNPEEVFAWKVGALALAAVVVGLSVLIGAMR